MVKTQNSKKVIQTLEDLTLDTKNANKGTDRGRKMLLESLSKYGAGRSILVDKAGRIIAGNKTVEAATKNGGHRIRVVATDGDELVVVQRTDLDLNSKKARELAVADNRVTDVGLDWDADVLKELDIDLSQFFTNAEQLRLGIEAEAVPTPKVDQAIALQRKWKTARGQIWNIGNHRLMCGDATDKGNVSELLAGKTPELCVTDPLYGVSYNPEWRAMAGVNKNDRKMGKVVNDDRSDWSEAWRLFPGSVAYIWHAGKFASGVQQSLETCGFEIVCQIIWAKDKFALSRGDYHWKHEPCWYAVRKGSKHSWSGGRDQSTLWEIDRADDSGHGHGTQKPLECMARPIRNHDGDVYDPFAGTGTTICAAQTLDRRCWAMEIDPLYSAVALERLAEMGLSPKLAS